MKMKKIIAITLAVVGILSTGAAETRADSFVVKQGFYQTSQTAKLGTFSGDNFALDYNVGGGIFLGDAYVMFFETGTLVAGLGNWTPPPSVPDVFFGNAFGTIQVGNVSCDLRGPRMWWLSDVHQPADGSTSTGRFFSGEAPFTMTGKLVLGPMGPPNMIVDIEGSGIVHVTVDPSVEDGRSARTNSPPFPNRPRSFS